MPDQLQPVYPRRNPLVPVLLVILLASLALNFLQFKGWVNIGGNQSSSQKVQLTPTPPAKLLGINGMVKTIDNSTKILTISAGKDYQVTVDKNTKIVSATLVNGATVVGSQNKPTTFDQIQVGQFVFVTSSVDLTKLSSFTATEVVIMPQPQPQKTK